MKTGVYAITHLASGRVYIGSSYRIANRWLAHRWHLERGKHHCQYLQRAWAKHGPDEFDFRVLEECPRQELLIREQRWLDSTEGLFNATRIAGAIVLSPDAISRRNDAIRAAYARKPPVTRSAAHRAKLSAALKGKVMPPRSAEHRRKIGLNAWRLHTPAAVAKRLATMSGRGWSEKRRLAERSVVHAKAEWLALSCCECGATFRRRANQERSRIKRGRSGPLCGPSCRGRASHDRKRAA